jgi:hypothetical protein
MVLNISSYLGSLSLDTDFISKSNLMRCKYSTVKRRARGFADGVGIN